MKKYLELALVEFDLLTYASILRVQHRRDSWPYTALCDALRHCGRRNTQATWSLIGCDTQQQSQKMFILKATLNRNRRILSCRCSSCKCIHLLTNNMTPFLSQVIVTTQSSAFLILVISFVRSSEVIYCQQNFIQAMGGGFMTLKFKVKSSLPLFCATPSLPTCRLFYLCSFHASLSVLAQ